MASILVLSDDKDICGVIKFVLERARNDAIIMASSLAQLSQLASHQLPDLIVLEFVARIDDLDIGIPVYQQIRAIELLRQVPVLFWSVPNPTYTYPNAQRLGVAGCIAMPPQANELVEARDAILAGGTYYLSFK